MKNSLVAILVLLSMNIAFADSDSATLTFERKAEKILRSNPDQAGRMAVEEGRVIELHPSFKDYLPTVITLGVATEAEVSEIEEFLKSKGIDLNSKPVQMTVTGRKLSWSKKISILNFEKGKIKLSNGNIISIQPEQNWADLVKAIYEGFRTSATARGTAYLFFPPANAQGNEFVEEATAEAKEAASIVSASLAGAWGAFRDQSKYYWEAYGLLPFAYKCKLIDLPLAKARYEAAKEKYDALVDCGANGEFVAVDFPSFEKTVESDYKDGVKKVVGDYEKKIGGKLTPELQREAEKQGHGRSLYDAYCEYSLSRSISDAARKSGKSKVSFTIPGEILKAAKVQGKCTPKLAQQVDDFLFLQAQKEETQIAQNIRSRVGGRSGPTNVNKHGK